MRLMRGNARQSPRSASSIADGVVFAGCTPRERALLDRLAAVVTVPADHELTRQGSRGREFGVILDGEAVVEIDGAEVARLSAGDHYGEIALLDRTGRDERRATVRTVRPTTVAAMSVREFRTAIAQLPDAATRIAAAAQRHSTAA